MLYQPPSPQRKKDVVPKESTKLRRPTFLKRSSEPLLNVKNANTQVRIYDFFLSTYPGFSIITQ